MRAAEEAPSVAQEGDNLPMLSRFLLSRTPDTSFAPPDAGKGCAPYTCTFHWVPTPDGRVIGLDVIRSDDCGRLGLRVFAFERGGIRALVHEAPAGEWAPFATERPTAPDGGRNWLGRGPGWVAGAVRAPGQSLPRVRFAFSVQPAAPGLQLRPSLSCALRLKATDYLDARTTGFIELDGERLEIDARGPLSIHRGRKLTRYAYVAAVPRDQEGGRLVAVAVGRDTLRVGGAFLGKAVVSYGFGAQGVPERSLHLGLPGRDLELGSGRRLILEDLRAFRHTLLGEPTVSGWARGRLEGGGVSEVMEVVVDYRGEPFASLIG